VQGTIYPHILGRTDMKKFIATIIAALLLWPAVASAQYSDGYNFLKSVRERDGVKATEILGKPGNVIVDTKDVSTGEAALHIVTKRRDTTWLSFLLGKGAKPDIKDADGNTPLLLATQIGYAEAADLLLKRRASVDAINSRGETPLILATQKRDVAMVRLLLAAGANPRRTDRAAGMSALDYATRDNRAGVILKLLQDAKAAKTAAGPV
jgi:ankyrin repeat protein